MFHYYAQCFMFFILLISSGDVEAASSHRFRKGSNVLLDSTSQPYRTAYHFQPPKNWMNDPNGPMYYKGVYHLFYQYNPYSAVWGNMTWGHSVSYNLVDWIHLDYALNPTDTYDINGCFSGSTTIIPGGKPMIIYTGSDLKNRQVQNLAMPKNASDPLLREWVKYDHNPLLVPPQGVGIGDFRDPTTAWLGKDKIFRMIIGSEINGHDGAALLYKSEDFVNWEKIGNPLHSSNKTTMWECPDFFPVSVDAKNGVDTSLEGDNIKHVLKASFNDQDHYIIGRYDSDTDNFIVETDFLDSDVDLRYDYGMFYASKTFYDSSKDRRILWGWVAEADDQSKDINRGWSGLQSFPRSIWLDKNGKKLVQWPIQEIEGLRENEIKLENKEIEGGDLFEITNITASQADVEITFNLPKIHKAEALPKEMLDPQLLCTKNNASTYGVLGPFGLLALASENLTEYTAIYFRIYKGHNNFVALMCNDQSRSSLAIDVKKSIFGTFIDIDPLTEKISLRSLIDHSIIESYGGEGRGCITTRVYPRLAIDERSHLYVFNYGSESVTVSELSGWSMKRAQIFPVQKRRKSGNGNKVEVVPRKKDAPEDAPENDDEPSRVIRTFPNGLVIEEVARGKPDGKKADRGKKISVRYVGELKKNGKIFDSNIGRAPFKFRLGVGQVIKGWDIGVNGMRVGDKRRLTIPPSMGYGAEGAPPAIPPNAWLVFDIQLLHVA